MYAKVKNNQVAQYPYSVQQLGADNPNVSLPANLDGETLARFGVVRVIATGQPEHDRLTQTAVEAPPVYNAARDRWEQAWQVVPLSDDEIVVRKHALQAAIVAGTQQRLDDFARSRGYDGVLSACTYATSPTPRFAAEGQYCVAQRDATWAKLYEILAEVEAGARPVPTSFADIEPHLPALAWPS